MSSKKDDLTTGRTRGGGDALDREDALAGEHHPFWLLHLACWTLDGRGSSQPVLPDTPYGNCSVTPLRSHGKRMRHEGAFVKENVSSEEK